MAITITNPVQYRVFQRSGTTGAIAINGTYTGTPTAIEATFNGGAYATIDAAPSGGVYSGSLAGQTQGQGTLTVRFTNDAGQNASVTYIGIGEIFIIAGQSNACGQTTVNNVYYHPTLKACLFGNDYNWKELVDPTDSPTSQVDSVSQDTNPGGSCWMILATYIMQNQNVPVAFIPCALLGTTISQWQPGGNHLDRTTLYGSMNYRAQQVGAKKALWWQGESDAVAGTTQANYNAYLDTLANALNSDYGIKLMPCKLMDLDSGVWMSNETPINAAIADAWADNSNVLTGPDFNDYKLSEHGGDIHYGNNWVYLIASRWWQAIRAAYSWADHIVQSSANWKAANTVTCAFKKNVTAGNLIVVHVSQYGGTIMNSSSISDGVNTYHLIDVVTSYAGDSLWRQGMYYAYNAAAGATTITFTGTSTPSISLVIEEYSGILTTDPLDKYATGNTSGYDVNMDSGATPTTTQADELIVVAAAPYSSTINFMRPGTSFLLHEVFPMSSEDPVASASRVVSSTGAYHGIIVQTETTCGWICKVATFKRMASVAVSQEGFRFRNDDGDEAGASWMGAQDTAITAPADVNTRIRFVVDASGDPAAMQYQLEIQKQGESTWTKL